MATDIQTSATITAAWKPYRLTVEQFLAMIDAGIFPHDAHVELLGGILVQMMTKGTPHDYSLGALGYALRALAPPGWMVREDKSLQLGPRSRPEPDIAIVRGPNLEYARRTPHARETALVAEVSESSYAYDHGAKWRRYAAARIPIYWIVHLSKKQIEVYGEPTSEGRLAAYGTCDIFGIDTAVPVIIDGVEVGRVAVRDLMP